MACVLSPMSHPPGPGGTGSQQLIPPQPHSSTAQSQVLSAVRPFCFLATASHRDIPVPGSSPSCHRASRGHQGKSLTVHPARARAQGSPVPGDLAAQSEWLESCPWGRFFHPPLHCRCPGAGWDMPALRHPWATSQGVTRWSRGRWESPALAMCSPPTHSSAQDRESSGCLAGLCDTDHPEHPLSGPPFPADLREAAQPAQTMPPWERGSQWVTPSVSSVCLA